MRILLILGITAAVLLFLAFLPALLSSVLDPLNTRRIRKLCAEQGVEVIEIKPWPNHYGVRYLSGGKSVYAKCVVTPRRIRWLTNAPG
jgi:hypothetical protein